MSESPTRNRRASLASLAVLLLAGCGTRSILGQDDPPPDVVEDVLLPDADVIPLDADVVLPDADVIPLDADVIPLDADVILPDADVILPDADVILPDADVIRLDADVVLPDADVVLPDADVVLPDADVVLPDADVVLPPVPGILRSAARFTILAGSTVSNLGASMIIGEVGVNPGTALVGIPAGVIVHAGTPVAALAQADTTAAYNTLAGLPCGTTLTGSDLGGRTLAPGVYCFSSSAMLTGTVVLDGQGQPDPLFIFQVGSTLITSNGAAVNMINGARPCGVYWQTGSSATIGIGSRFAGNIIAFASVTLTNGVSLNGRALARVGAVTMETNQVSNASCPDPALPVPADAGMADAAPADRPDAAADARDD